jgi:ATP-dependent RNA helicase DeaD
VVEIETETEEEETATEIETEKRWKTQKNENMTRFFFNLGKRDQLKKMDMLEIINKATSKSKKRADIGDIEILEKFSFFEVEKSFKEEVLKGIATQKFKGKDMRAEVAN